MKSKKKGILLWLFTKWSIMFQNYLYLKEHGVPFEIAENGRTEGTFTNFDSLDDEIDDLLLFAIYKIWFRPFNKRYCEIDTKTMLFLKMKLII